MNVKSRIWIVGVYAAVVELIMVTRISGKIEAVASGDVTKDGGGVTGGDEGCAGSDAGRQATMRNAQSIQADVKIRFTIALWAGWLS